MTEAHQLSSIEEHRDINYDKDLGQRVYNLIFRSWRQRIAMFRNTVRNSAYPAHIESLWILMATLVGLHFADINSTYGFMNYFTRFRVISE